MTSLLTRRKKYYKDCWSFNELSNVIYRCRSDSLFLRSQPGPFGPPHPSSNPSKPARSGISNKYASQTWGKKFWRALLVLRMLLRGKEVSSIITAKCVTPKLAAWLNWTICNMYPFLTSPNWNHRMSLNLRMQTTSSRVESTILLWRFMSACEDD